MFEDSIEKRDPITIIFYSGLAPFALAWWIHRGLATGFAMEAYLITCCVFVVDPFEIHNKYVKQGWYWRIMARAGVAIHPMVLVAVWFLDKLHPVFVDGTGTIFFMALVIAVAEAGILQRIVKQFGPAREGDANASTSG